MPSPQQPNDPDGSRPNLDIGPPAVGAAMSRQGLRHDPMLAQAAWTPDRDERAWDQPRPAERPRTADQEPAATQGAQPRSVVAGPRRHTIARGDTFASIAQRYYGSEEYAEPIRQSNRGRIGRDGLHPGDLLVIPPREELEVPGGWAVQGHSAAVSNSTPGAGPEGLGSARPHPRRRFDAGDDRHSAWTDPSESSPERASSPSARRAPVMVHMVGPDETPRSIARDRLGDARRANEIIELNREQLATEGRWRAGLRILLPADAGPPQDAH